MAIPPCNSTVKCGVCCRLYCVCNLCALAALKQQRDKLKQYQKRVSLQLQRERELARQLLHDGKKEKAKLLLKKKRYQEQLLQKTDNQISNLEKMVEDIEFAQIELKVIEGLKVGNECLKKMHEVMSIEEVEKIMDETQEGIEYQRQIDEILSGSLTAEDEEAILEELEAITQEDMELSEPLPEAPAEPLPEVPAEPLPEVPAEPLPDTSPERRGVKNKPKPQLVAAS
ncbi:charged multivesicular body protein 6 [Ascaphus truei]|uniref:charged multivesicular body protein 6 n=1 Tax=Ascaphus truei TaxID=8439 RepID=UPI003F59577B